MNAPGALVQVIRHLLDRKQRNQASNRIGHRGKGMTIKYLILDPSYNLSLKEAHVRFYPHVWD